MARCKKCGYPLLPKHDKCPKCGASVIEQAVTPIDGVDVVSRKTVWSIAPGQLARRISEKELADCSAVNGVVIQDGVTAAIFVDGQLANVMDGGLYQFNPEKVIERSKTIVNLEKESEQQVTKQSFGKRVSSFFTGLMGAKKHAESPEKTEKRIESWKEIERESVRRTVVSIYLISNRLFQMAFGFEKTDDGTCTFKPYRLKAGIMDVEIGVNMQLRISDFNAFRLNYLNDQRQVTVTDLQEMTSPWVQQILTQTLENMQMAATRLTPEQQDQIRQQLKQELEHRLNGIEVVQVMDVTTESDDFEQLRQQEHDLWVSEQEADFYVRKNEFLNRYTGYQQEQELTKQSMTHDQELNLEREKLSFLSDMNKLNQDKLLSDDEMARFVELHEMEVRLRQALQNADEQTRMQDVEKILNDVKTKKLMSDDELAAVEESIRDKRFERQQMSDVLQHAALTKASIEKMRAEAGLYAEKTQIDMQKEQADFDALKQRSGFDIEKAEIEAALYGKRYVLEKQKAIDKLEMEGIELDADLEIRRKRDDYDFENRKREAQFDFDTRKRDTEFEFEIDVKRQEWEDERQFKLDERQFRLDDHQTEMEKRREEQRQQRTSFDFDMRKKEDQANFESRKQNTEFDFDLEGKRLERDDERQIKLDDHQTEMEKRREEQRQQRTSFDFDVEKQRKTFNFDLDQKSKDADIERTLKLGSHEQDLADRESRRRMEELEQKGNIAMRNMQAMMEAKRAAKQDELQHERTIQQAKFEAEERRMQTQKEMTAEQIMAAQIREMDAGAQAKFAESFSAKNSAERERQVADEKAQMYERMMQQMQTGNQQNAQMQQQMMQQMMEMAKMGFQANANVATGRIDALKETLQPTSPMTPEPTPAASTPEPPKTLRLNTQWLRQHGYEGSFNELAGQLANMGGDISQDFDEQGNPVIVVEQLTDSQVMDVLIKLGVKF
ncbi:MAG: hypothetical protein MSA35_03215 [Prevotella sp.]|nr:hypothetical protein [Prevotella sp.]